MFNIEQFTFYHFFLVSLALLIGALVYIWYLRPLLFEQLADNQTFLLLIERGLLVFVSIVMLYAFISLNPITNGIIAIASVFFAKDVLSNILHGILLIRELKLHEGKTIKIGQQNGIISRLSYTGMQLTNDSYTEFIPFQKAYNQGIKEESTKNATLLTLFCEANSDVDLHTLIEPLESKLFSLPFLIYQSKPQIEIQGDKIKIIVGIENYAFKSSLINALEQTGVKVRTI